MWHETLWIYQYARHYWKQMVFYTALGLVNTAFSLVSSLISRDMVDIITGKQTGLLARTFCFFIIFAIGNIFLSQLSTYFSNKISISVDNEIKADIFNKMLVTDLEAIQNYHTGDLLTRWSSDASNISSGILNWIPNLIIFTVRFISAFALVCYNDFVFAILALLGVPVSMFMSRRLLKRMRGNNKRSAAMNAKMSGFNQEAFSNIQTIKAFDLINLYSRHLRELQKDYLEMRLEFQRLSMVTSVIMSVTGLAVSYSCYGFGIYRVWSGAISYGTMTMFLSLSGTLTGTLNQLISLVPAAVSLTTSARRLMDIIEMPKEDFSQSDEASMFFRQNKQTGISLEFSDIAYSYSNGNEVFKGACIKAKPHEIVAIVGPSGEGKTTMLRLILSLLHPQEGNAVLYGGTSGKFPVSPSTRQLFSYVPQGNTMFSGTIADNMRNIKPDATDEEIICALKMACAWDFISKLPDGINSKIGERGAGFSEGQAQRLSIARSLIRHYPRTCIVTTHRPTVLSVCSRVYAIKDKKCQVLSDEEIENMIQNF